MARQPIEDMRSRTFGSRGAARRLHLEQLPGYAPDLDPDEGIWNYLKRVELGNVCCPDLAYLHQEFLRARERLRHKKEIIRSCALHCGYSLEFPLIRSVKTGIRSSLLEPFSLSLSSLPEPMKFSCTCFERYDDQA